MVAKITTPLSARKTLNYNEQKVANGKALCLGAENCLHELQQLTSQKKLSILQDRNVLNDRAKTKTVHVSLNFDPTEKLTDGTLRKIAMFYMDKLGFAEQPYFIYQHFDAGHPHIHIVSTLIRQDGTRINTHNIGRNQSEQGRKEIEQHFGLVRAKKKQVHTNDPVNSMIQTKVMYGKEETKRSIAAVLDKVITHYNYGSLQELNAVLHQYKITADRGCEMGNIYNKRGLYYRILDKEGKKVGVPIKASALAGKPVLSFLERQMKSNQSKRDMQKQTLKKVLNDILFQSPKTIVEFMHLLNRNNIAFFIEHSSEGDQKILFIDNRNKCVFEGMDIEEGFGLPALRNRFSVTASDIASIEEKNVAGVSEKGEMNLHRRAVQLRKRVFNESNALQQLQREDARAEKIPQPLVRKNKRQKKNRESL